MSQNINETLSVGEFKTYFPVLYFGQPASPSITTQPANQTVSEGAKATFEVTATGKALAYQWQQWNGGSWGNVIGGSGGTTAAYMTSATTMGDNGAQFRCVVTNIGGSAASLPATLTVYVAAPLITGQPGNQVVREGQTANFIVTAAGTALNYQWQRWNGGSWGNVIGGSGGTTVSYTTAATTVGDNGAQFRCLVMNSGGSAVSDTATLVVNPAAPDTTITGGWPENPTNGTSAAFTFTSGDPTATFECRLDGGSFSACTSGQTFTGLSQGQHTFEVRAKDPAGYVDGTPATYTWTIDLTAPDTVINPPLPANPTTATTASFNFSSGDPTAVFECRLDGGSFSACTSGQTFTGLSQGQHTFEVRAKDPAGNVDGTPAAYTWAIDLTAPDTVINPPLPANPTTATTASFNFSSGDPTAVFECRLDGGNFSACTSGQTFTGLSQGQHTFEVRAKDPAGNVDGTPATYTWAIDLTAPDTVINPPLPANPTTATTATFSFTSTDPTATFECRLDGGGYSACTSPKTYNGPLSVGSHTFEVRAKDPAGNVDGTPAVYTWAVGQFAVSDFPNYRVFQRDIGGTSKNVTLSGTYANMTWNRVEARLLGHGTNTALSNWATIDSTPGGGTFSGSLSVPQGGWYNIEVQALDGAGSVIATSRGTNKWGVGMNILCIGQSNMTGTGPPPYTVAASDLAVNYSNAGRWEHLVDPYDDESPVGAVDNDDDEPPGGSMIPGLANSLLQTFNFPVAFVPAPRGGSPLIPSGNFGWAYRNPSNPYDPTTLYGQSITKAQTVGGVELIVMNQGEADFRNYRTEAEYETYFNIMIGNYRQDLRPDIPIFICQLGTIGAPEGTDEGLVGIRKAQGNLDNGTTVFMGATEMDQPRHDGWHYNTPGLTVIGGRLANAVKYYFGHSSYYRGPAIQSASFSDGNRDQVTVTMVHRGGTDLTPAAGITGFEVFDNGLPVAIQSAVRQAANAVRLTLAAPIASGHTATLRYLYGKLPDVSGLVKDNSPLALPLENTPGSITITDTP